MNDRRAGTANVYDLFLSTPMKNKKPPFKEAFWKSRSTELSALQM